MENLGIEHSILYGLSEHSFRLDAFLIAFKGSGLQKKIRETETENKDLC